MEENQQIIDLMNVIKDKRRKFLELYVINSMRIKKTEDFYKDIIANNNKMFEDISLVNQQLQLQSQRIEEIEADHDYITNLKGNKLSNEALLKYKNSNVCLKKVLHRLEKNIATLGNQAIEQLNEVGNYKAEMNNKLFMYNQLCKLCLLKLGPQDLQ